MELVKYNNNSIANVTSLASMPSGDFVKLTTNTISSGVSSSSFTSNIDGTYRVYLFKFINIHGATDNADFTVNFSSDGGSNYNLNKTTTWNGAYHQETGGSPALSKETSNDLVNGSGYQILAKDPHAADADGSTNGELYLFNPYDSTTVKQFLSTVNFMADNYSYNAYIAGFINATDAVNAVDFKFASGNIDSGVIKMYGLRLS